MVSSFANLQGSEWYLTSFEGTNTAGATRSPSPNSPIVNGAPTKTGEQRPICKICKKPVDPNYLDSHVSLCLEDKKEKARKKKERKEARAKEAAAKVREQADKDKDGDSSMVGGGNTVPASQEDGDKASLNGDVGAPGTSTKKPPKKSASKAQPSDSSKKTKKRKADDSGAQGAADKEPKKKKLKKDEPPKPKVTKPKGPVNVEIQCGVPLDKEKGGFCARSLTCKSHSMGLKRAVPGRSLPYDQLLAMYQKKNQAKQQKALMEAQVGAVAVDEDAEGGAVDSEEEREAVMKGLGRWRPRPLEQVVTVPGGRWYGYVRLKEMLGNALAGGGGGRFFGVPAVGPVVGTEGVMEGVEATSAEGGNRRASSAVGGGAHAHPVPKGVAVPVRKGSVASSAGGA